MEWYLAGLKVMTLVYIVLVVTGGREALDEDYAWAHLGLICLGYPVSVPVIVGLKLYNLCGNRRVNA